MCTGTHPLTHGCAVTLANIRETHRFSVSAWRLAMLLPTTIKNLTVSELRVKIWQLAVKLMFHNYNDLLETGLLVKCSDGKTRNITMRLSQWLGDGPEIAACCCLVQVQVSLCPVVSCTQITCVLNVYCRETVICAKFPRANWTIWIHLSSQELRKICSMQSTML